MSDYDDLLTDDQGWLRSFSASLRILPKIEQLTVHLPCGSLRGGTFYGPQGCPCAPTEPWPGCDVSRITDLCQVCARGTAGSVTRWSYLGCLHCRAVEHALQAWLGIRVLPLGRHSLMNGVGRRVASGPSTDADTDAFCQSFNALGLSWSRLREWGDAEVQRLASVAAFDVEEVPLDQWQRAFPVSAPASVDAYERFLQTKLPTQVVAP